MGGFAIPSPPFSPEPFQADFSSLSARALAYVQAQAGAVAPLTLTSPAAGSIPLTCKGAASQTANLQEWQDSAAAVKAYVDKDGGARFKAPIIARAGGAPSNADLAIYGDDNLSFPKGIQFDSTNGGVGFYIGGARYAFIDGSLRVRQSGRIGWSSSDADASANAPDTGFGRHSAGVIRATDSAGTGIKALIGGGASVASAAALPLPTGRVFHVTGTTTITSITSTNFQNGAVITLIFDGILTFTDGGNLKLAGNFVTTADDTITLVYDGTNWYEVCRSVN